MLVTTTPTVEGRRITKYCGVVAGEAILGANVFKDLFAGIRDLVGGRSATYERELQRARDIAIEEMQEKAAALGGNAVVGIDLDYEVLGQGNGMLMVSASGTAVVLEQRSGRIEILSGRRSLFAADTLQVRPCKLGLRVRPQDGPRKHLRPQTSPDAACDGPGNRHRAVNA